ncbi:alpha subunit of ribonucleoside-diphosphate reductase [Pavlovales sp. CCMP2436]|nr:alpha subunit of ribonucleoside-diphosphate reductase [Pavlovales sp. CCMP2436]
MEVVKRDGRREPVMFDKITARIKKLCYGFDPSVIEPIIIAQKVIVGVFNGVTTVELDDLAAQTAAYMTTQHPDYARLAARIAVSNLHKMTDKSFATSMRKLHGYVDPKTGKNAALIATEIIEIVDENPQIEGWIVYDRDFEYDYFGFKTLERSYLLRMHGKVVERPQHMLMRVALGIHKRDLASVLETYNYMSERWFTHATPTMFNAGTPQPQMSSCFLLQMQEDSISGIFETLKLCAKISKSAGGIGISCTDIRATGSYIKGTGGQSNGLVPMLRVFDATARYVDQGGGKRKGAFAVYIEPWHADIFSFLELRKNHGKEEARARDLFYALWVPDIFMKRVEVFFCFFLLFFPLRPGGSGCQRLSVTLLSFGVNLGVTKFEKLSVIKCSDKCALSRSCLRYELLEVLPPHLFVIRYFALPPPHTHTTRSPPPPVPLQGGEFDHALLRKIAYTVARNLNRVIDNNFYPVEEARRSNMRHRPVGIGVQGLADAFIKLRLPFDSDGAKRLNVEIFETIYYGALEASCDLAKIEGPYETYAGSPISKGILQYDMWGVTPSPRYDWAALKAKIALHGVRNSLLVAPMPTASTAQARFLYGTVSNCPRPPALDTLLPPSPPPDRYLLRELMERGMWTDSIRNQIIAHNGSVQNIDQIPDDVKAIYKTCWELKQRDLIDMAADRGAFIDQSQSFNVFVQDANYGKLSSMHFYGWKKGLKTGMYYLRSRAAADAIKFTVDQASLAKANAAGAASKEEALAQMVCSIDNKEECMSCGA